MRIELATALIMGNRSSKHSKKTAVDTKKKKKTSAKIYATEFETYEAACEEDTEIQSFDRRMHARMSNVISTLSTDVEGGAVSFDSLKVVTESLLDVSQEVMKFVLDCKKDIWKHKEVLELAVDFFDNSTKTLDFCYALEESVCLVGSNHQLILSGNGYKKTLKELKKFKDAETPFGKDFFKMFQIVYEQQMLMLEKLQIRTKRLDNKFKRIRTWRKIASIIFVAIYATLLICSVVAAAIAATAVAAALASTIAPMGAMGKWLHSLWKKYENAVKGQKDVFFSMQEGTFVAVKDLDYIRLLIQQLDKEIKRMVTSAETAVEHHDTIKIQIHEINKVLLVFKKKIEELGNRADLCSKDIIKAREVFFNKVMHHT
ncbi:PREDICTED: UPF0496 protein At4g34320-like [Camelina sativa]|uniref:UPF0496 protein At4g34320-like n=1 Tax=Camelina sativa TaxID=90675 RepID=A0ABM1QRA7_CAMSA|nr:PREDICTED: UPF0496 protein At4g34320-like [Camelina sativa]